ncbi:MAG: DUF5719 family protein [Microthrixaceae bacterium]
MDRARLVLVSIVVVAVGLMAGVWNGRAPLQTDARTGIGVPAVGAENDISSTWFCAGGSASLDPAPHHQIFITNTGSRSVETRVTAFGAEGKVGSQEIKVEANAIVSLDLDVLFSASGLAAMVEAPRGGVVATSWIISSDVADAAPCQREASASWYFPSQTSLIGATAQLVLFNPFSSDAGVDVTSAVADGVRSPTEWTGVVVPAGTVKVLDLAAQIQRRDQFAVTVRVRSGRAFAQSVQSFAQVKIAEVGPFSGLRITAPVAQPRESWDFAGGFKDSGASESLVVFNPNTTAAVVRVQVTPYGGTDMAPEPFEMRVPARRYSVLDLSKEGRVPDVGFHSISIESEPGEAVVVQRTIRLTAAPATGDAATVSRASLGDGVGADTGVSGSAKDWILDGILTGASNDPMAFIRNPGDKRVKVDVSTRGDDGKPALVLRNQEIAPGDGVAVRLSVGSVATAATRTYRVDASGPVVVESLRTFESVPDFSLSSAFPLGPGE